MLPDAARKVPISAISAILAVASAVAAPVSIR